MTHESIADAAQRRRRHDHLERFRHWRKDPSILDVTPRPENHHFGRLFITMWVRSTGFLFVALALCLVSPPTLAQTEACERLTDGPLETAKELFKYSQFAERLSAQKEDEHTNCCPLVPRKSHRRPIEIRAQWNAENLGPLIDAFA